MEHEGDGCKPCVCFMTKICPVRVWYSRTRHHNCVCFEEERMLFFQTAKSRGCVFGLFRFTCLLALADYLLMYGCMVKIQATAGMTRANDLTLVGKRGLKGIILLLNMRLILESRLLDIWLFVRLGFLYIGEHSISSNCLVIPSYTMVCIVTACNLHLLSWNKC